MRVIALQEIQCSYHVYMRVIGTRMAHKIQRMVPIPRAIFPPPLGCRYINRFRVIVMLHYFSIYIQTQYGSMLIRVRDVVGVLCVLQTTIIPLTKPQR